MYPLETSIMHWFDAINCGHKDGYTNAIIYRAWRCLADLEARLGRAAKQSRYESLADRLKAATRRPSTIRPPDGWLGGKARTGSCTIMPRHG